MAAGPTSIHARPATARNAAPRAARATGSEALQRRLKVGAAGDRFEREADRIADHVVGPSTLPAATPPPVISPLGVQRMPLDEPEPGPEEPAQRMARVAGPEEPTDEEPPPVTAQLQRAMDGSASEDVPALVQRAMESGPEAPKEEEPVAQAMPVQRAMAGGPETSNGNGDLAEALTVQREPGPGAAGGTAPAGVESSIQRMRSGAAPGLDDGARDRMEDKMGVDLSGIRVHTGEGATKAADGLNAKAFTVGQDMFFGRGQYDPDSTAGQHLIAHETAHTVQQKGGSTGAQRIQRATAKGKSDTNSDDKKKVKDAPLDKVEGSNWAVDFTKPDGHSGTITLPALELPTVGGGLKGTSSDAAASSGRSLPAGNAPFRLDPVPKRGEGKAFETWYAHAKDNFAAGAKTALEKRIKRQRTVEPMEKGDRKIYHIHTGKRPNKAGTVMMGTIDELSQHDGVLRPMLSPSGAESSVDADHILELQIGGKDAVDNMWLLKSKYNQDVGNAIKTKVNKSIKDTLEKANRQVNTKKAKTSALMPANATAVKRNWVMRFKTVRAGKFGTTSIHWTRAQIEKGEQVQHFRAMTPKELVRYGFVFKDGEVPKNINVFPSKSGGRMVRFAVSRKGDKLKKPGFFYKGIEVTGDADLTLPTAENKNAVIAKIPISRPKKAKQKGKKKKKLIGFEHTTLDLKHEEDLGFGAVVTRKSIRAAFAEGLTFEPLSPITFGDPRITADGELFAEGSISSSKALFPKLKVPIVLKGDQISMNFPVPTDSLSIGPVSVTEAALQLGVGASGFFIAGSAGIAVDQLGSGMLSAKTTKDDILLKGSFAFDFNFVEKAELEAEYSLAKDDFKVKGKLTVKKGTLPGVDRGSIDVAVTNDTFGVTGTLTLGGILKGSTITVGYTPETGLLIEGKDIPLPIDKLPGVSDAKVTVRAQRNPEGVWLVSGAGSATLKAPGASGKLKVAMKGEAVRFFGRVDLAKGPAKGYIQITATNMAIDDQGDPIEGGPIGELQIWGMGKASIAFGKVLTGTAAIEYTRDGRIIITGEIALPPTVDLFKRVPYNKPIYQSPKLEFPIWGVKLGPVGFGIFAFVDARIDFLAFVGPGQLRDTKVSATMDLEKPEEAQVEGNAKFHIPAYAGFKLDLGGGLKAQAAVAFVKGRVGLDGTLGLGAEASIDVGVKWSKAEGFAAEALAEIEASPKFELGVNASVTAGVDLPWPLPDIDHTWGPWRKKLGEFGPNMVLSAKFPVKYSEKDGLDLALKNIQVTKPKLDGKAMMKSAFDTLV